VNDATALVAYNMATTAVVAGTFSLREASVRFLVAGGGGVAVGLLAGLLVARVRQLVGKAPTVEATISLLTPYVAYIPAEKLHASGVLAVVAVGLYLGRRGPKIVSAQSRLQSRYMWRMITFLLEGLIFLLVGLELPVAFDEIRRSHHTIPELVLYAGLVSGAAIAVRLIWMYPGALAARLIQAPFRGFQREPMPPWRNIIFTGWAGIRGGDSLVIALSLPSVMSANVRGMIIVLTFVVIVVTLVFLGLTLGPITRRLGLEGDDIDEREEHAARQKLLNAARGPLDASRSGAVQFVRTALEVVSAQRRELIRLRDDEVIGDDVLNKLQHELDLQEVLLESRPTAPPRVEA
jgi:CPA1 family monovalent cation:H+ antiporter